MMGIKVRMQQAGDTVWERVLLNPKVWSALIALLVALAKEYGWDISTEVFVAIEAFLLVLIAAI